MPTPSVQQRDVEALTEEATVDAYGEDEQRSGFLVMMQDNIVVPFLAALAGVEIQVVGFDGLQTRIIAYCEREGQKFSVDVLDIKPTKNAEGHEWLDAYRYWCNE